MKILKKIGAALAFPWKHNKVFSIVTCIVLALIIAISIVATQVLLISNTFNTVFGEERRVLVSGDPSTAQYYTPDDGIESKADALANANAVNEELCEEGFVLLKNDNSLPLAKNAKVSVFGMNSVDMVYGGSGSAAKDSGDSIDLYQSLENAGIEYNPQLKSFYEGKQSRGLGRGTSPGMGDRVVGFATGELALSEYSGGIGAYTEGYKDAALVVISRIGGEGYDLPRTMINADGSIISGAAAGVHYLELDENEKALLAEVCAEDSGFDNVIMIINCATSMELGFMDDAAYNGKIKGAVWIGTTGGTGMNALGKILVGEVNPSGRLVDTYAADFSKAPSWQNFGFNLTDASKYNAATLANGNAYTLNGTAQDAHFVEYEEGIYVGYRYYETMGYTQYEKDGDYSWYEENVVFPFGYGLSYTTFEWSVTGWQIGGEQFDDGAELGEADKDKKITVTVNVTNTGDVAGKDVVQLYYTAPYIAGEVEKSHVVLAAFAKTPVIQPDDTKSVTLEFALRDTASYDYADLNKNGASVYEADEGDYTLMIGRNAHEAWTESELTLNYSLDADLVYATDSATDNPVENRFDDVSSYIKTYLSRNDWEGTFPASPTEDEMAVDNDFIKSLSMEAYIGSGNTLDIDKKWYKEHAPRQRRSSLSYNETEVKLYQLIGADYNDDLWDKLLDQLTLEEMCYLIGTGNFNTAVMQNIDKPKTIDPDGPAGFTQFMTLIEATAVVYDTCFYCSECVIGATWNTELAAKMGNAIGNEALMGNERGDGRTYSGWYAPAVNIHRSPFSGRNWEYYSEDGLLTGKMAASVVAAAKDKGVYCYVKHFAVNDQETDRDAGYGLITWLNEQSMREIYLKPFELAVKEGGANAMMSSFNRIGKVWAGGSYELLTEILRNEWGFEGMVITDYGTASYMYSDQMIRAGGDLALFQDRQPSVSGRMVSPSHRYALRQATKNILYTVANSNAMNGMGEGIVYRYAMPYWKIVLIVADVVIVAGLAVWGFFSIRKSYKKVKDNNLAVADSADNSAD